jgi:tRNA-specific 2-thiouridylase
MLDVPFLKLDLVNEFRENVIDPLIDYYEKGLTPNPCVWCNSRVRFSVLMDKLKAMGFEYLATGHYANIIGGKLFKAEDLKKDQAYFLYDIERGRLKDILFPLGEMNKVDVYDMAHKQRLPVRYSKESQDCCIFMDKDLKAYLSSKIKIKPGRIFDLSGKVVGAHPGYQNFTIGQRRGYGGLGQKSYVVEIIPEDNAIVVGPEEYLFKNHVCFKINKPENFSAKVNDELCVKLRSTHEGANCRIEKLNFEANICKIYFNEPQRSPTPGQSAVLYKRSEVVGGGEIIKENDSIL